MINAGTWRDRTWPDGWTAVTEDGKRSAQFEHTVVLTKVGGWVGAPPHAASPAARCAEHTPPPTTQATTRGRHCSQAVPDIQQPRQRCVPNAACPATRCVPNAACPATRCEPRRTLRAEHTPPPTTALQHLTHNTRPAAELPQNKTTTATTPNFKHRHRNRHQKRQRYALTSPPFYWLFLTPDAV
jgi:hypothetical protein